MKLAVILSVEAINELLAACSAARTRLLTDTQANWDKFGQHRYNAYLEAEKELRTARDLAEAKVNDAIRRADQVCGRDSDTVADLTMEELARRAGGV